jgi:hypothetical protein
VALSKKQMSHIWALPTFNPAKNGSGIRYLEFLEGSPGINEEGKIDEKDPRFVFANMCPNVTPERIEPVIVINAGAPMFIEGYLRSIVFMRKTDFDARLLAWWPIDLAEPEMR